VSAKLFSFQGANRKGKFLKGWASQRCLDWVLRCCDWVLLISRYHVKRGLQAFFLIFKKLFFLENFLLGVSGCGWGRFTSAHAFFYIESKECGTSIPNQ
jgi:hypothetical protein